MKIAFLGTGLMGVPMARRLAGTHDVTVWNRSADKTAPLANTCTIAPDPISAVQDADVIITMLLDGPATRQVLNDATLTAMPPCALIVNMGSVDLQTDRDLAGRASALELSYLDAPVSGGVVGAKAGSLAILVGGDQADFIKAKLIFDLLGRATLLGDVGAGQVAKLANQLIVGITIGAVAEAFRLGQAGGCNPAALRDALSGGFADSRILDLHGARMVTGDFTPGGRSAAQLKDLNNALALAESNNLDLPLSQTVTAGFQDFVQNYDGGEKDHAAYYDWLALRQN